MEQSEKYLKELEVMALDYDKAGKELAQVLIEKASSILMLMANSKSVKEAEMKFACTPAGKREIELTYKIRGLKELISASKTYIRTKNQEYFNN